MAPVSRREFIRIATLLGGVSLFAGCNRFSEDTGAPDFIFGAPAVDPDETVHGVRNIYSVCGLCAGNCGIRCRVAQGRLVKIGGSPYHPASAHFPVSFETDLETALRTGASVCAAGGAGIQMLYDPFRVAVPLKRMGPRGSGKWRAISWKDALDEIVHGGDIFGEGNVAGLEAIKQSGDGFGFLAGRIDWGAMTFIKRFLVEIPGARLFRDKEALMELAAAGAADAVFGSGPVDADYARARFLLSFGDAPLDSGTPLVSIARQIMNARVDGQCLRWAVVDPRLSTSASRADLWVPVIPGKDAKLAAAITKALVENHPDSLRVSRDNVRKVASVRSIEDLSRECGIGSDIPVLLARLLAEAGSRAAVIPGKGIFAQPDGAGIADAILRLNFLVGSIPGSGGIVRSPHEFLDRAANRLLGSGKKAKIDEEIDSAVKALFLWRSDPVYSQPSLAGSFQDGDRVPLFVAIDSHISDTAALADYILPDTTYLERWDICASPPAVTNPGFGVRVPVVGGLEPRTGEYLPMLSQTRPMEDILIAIATRLDLAGFGKTSVNGIRAALDFYRQAVPAVFQSLKESDVSGFSKGIDPHKIFERGGIFASGLPERAVSEAAPSLPGLPKSALEAQTFASSDDSLLLISYSLPFHRWVQAVTSSWLMEIIPENRLLINVSDARRLKIGDAQKIILQSSSDTVQVECIAQVIPGIRPGVVALARGFGVRGLGSVSYEIENTLVLADGTRAAGVNPAILWSGETPVKVTIKPA